MLWVVPALGLLFLFAALRRRRALRYFTGGKARLNEDRYNVRPFKSSLLVAAVVLIVLALSRPVWTTETRTVERHGRDVVFVVDVSRSMLAQDLAPNRLTRAKLAILDTLEVLSGDRVALVAFAGTAVVKSPLTFDYGFVRLAVERLSSESVSRGGTLTGDALRVVRDSVFGGQVSSFRDVILITDGGDLGSLPVQAASELGALGARIITVGLGNELTGQLIPDPSEPGEYLRHNGEMVLTSLDSDTLREMASVTPGGLYVNVATGNFDLGVLYTQLLSGSDQKMLERTEREVFEERFQVFIAVALLLLVLEFLLPDLIRYNLRRKRRSEMVRSRVVTALVAVVAAGVLLPSEVQGNGVPERAEYEGRQAFAEGRFSDAFSFFGAAADARPGVPELIYDTGIAAYLAGDLEDAEALLRSAVEQGRRPEMLAAGHFALGNVKVRAVERELSGQAGLASDPQAAIDGLTAAEYFYRRALDLHPDWEKAAHNLEATRLRLQQLQQQLPPPEQSNSDLQEQQGESDQDVPYDDSRGISSEQDSQDRQSESLQNQVAQGLEEENDMDPHKSARAIIEEEQERSDQREFGNIRIDPVERDW